MSSANRLWCWTTRRGVHGTQFDFWQMLNIAPTSARVRTVGSAVAADLTILRLDLLARSSPMVRRSTLDAREAKQMEKRSRY
jgi:hypothetical protein